MRRPATVLVAGSGGVMVSWAVAQHSLLGGRWHFVLLIAAWIPLWLLAAWSALGISRDVSLVLVLVLAVALRLAAASGTTPSISNDLYRYTWNARVQLAGIDPYRYPPGAPQLVSLRHQSGVWPPPASCVHVGLRPGCTLVNRPNDRTIYPPVAEAWFVVVHVAALGSNGSRPWQLAGGLVDDAIIVLIAWALAREGRDPRQVAWYALAPLPVIEFAGNGHVDGLALLFLVAAALALRRGRQGWTGVLVGLATMVKVYPTLAVAVWWRRGRWRMAAFAAAVVVLAEAPHVVFVGTRVLGYLPGYLHEEHYISGGRFVLLSAFGLPDPLTTVLALAVILAVTLTVGGRSYEPAAQLVIVLTGLILVTTPVQPWYAATIAGLGALAGAPWLLILGLAAEPYYAAVILADPHQVAVGRIAYGAALVVVVPAVMTWRHQSACPAEWTELRPVPALRPPRYPA